MAKGTFGFISESSRYSMRRVTDVGVVGAMERDVPYHFIATIDSIV